MHYESLSEAELRRKFPTGNLKESILIVKHKVSQQSDDISTRNLKITVCSYWLLFLQAWRFMTGLLAAKLASKTWKSWHATGWSCWELLKPLFQKTEEDTGQMWAIFFLGAIPDSKRRNFKEKKIKIKLFNLAYCKPFFLQQFRKDLRSSARSQNLTDYLDVFHTKGKKISPEVLRNRAQDYFSHFILRLAYCKTEPLRKWLFFIAHCF